MWLNACLVLCSWTECNVDVNFEMQGDWMKVGASQQRTHNATTHSPSCATADTASTCLPDVLSAVPCAWPMPLNGACCGRRHNSPGSSSCTSRNAYAYLARCSSPLLRTFAMGNVSPERQRGLWVGLGCCDGLTGAPPLWPSCHGFRAPPFLTRQSAVNCCALCAAAPSSADVC